MRLIDADKLLDDLKEVSSTYLDTIVEWKDLVRTIENQPVIVTGTTETTSDGWIPVSERLPYDYGYILCTDKDGEVDSCTSDWFIKYKERYMAWMPTPEPYKERDKP